MDTDMILQGLSTLLIIFIMGYKQNRHSIKRGNEMVKKYSKSLVGDNDHRDL